MNLQPPAIQFVALVLERGGRDEMRFSPLCAGCGKIQFDVTEANFGVIGEDNFKMTPVGTYRGAKVSRIGGFAQLFCWECERKKETDNVPWANAAEFLRDHDDPAQQRVSPGFRCVTKRKRGGQR